MSSNLQARRRLQRMLRKQERRLPVALNLVSMIDMFTTLVFFLLITSTSVDVVPTPRDLTLPNSTSLQQAEDTPVVLITPRDIQLQGRSIMSIDEANQSPSPVLEPLKAELNKAMEMQISGQAANATTRGEVNIMADKNTPYALIKKVMATCGDAKFARISLSVNRHGTPVAPT
jgi:biopolymer transport protein ExbD